MKKKLSEAERRERKGVRQREYRKAHPEKIKAACQKWQKTNAEKVRAKSREYHKANPEYCREWKKTNPEKVKAACQKWRKANREKLKERNKAHPEIAKAAALKHNYGLTLAEYTALLDKQYGVCAICGKSEWGAVGNGHGYRKHSVPRVDHNHATGKVRGLLCHKCNRGLGFFNDDADLVFKAAHYLRRHQS